MLMESYHGEDREYQQLCFVSFTMIHQASETSHLSLISYCIDFRVIGNLFEDATELVGPFWLTALLTMDLNMVAVMSLRGILQVLALGLLIERNIFDWYTEWFWLSPMCRGLDVVCARRIKNQEILD